MNRKISKLFRKIATTTGTFNKPLYKSLKKMYEAEPYARWTTQRFLEAKLKEIKDDKRNL